MTSYPEVMYLMHRNHWRNTMLLSSLVIATLFAVKTMTCYMLSRQRRKIALVDSLTKSDHIPEDNSLPFKRTTTPTYCRARRVELVKNCRILYTDLYDSLVHCLLPSDQNWIIRLYMYPGMLVPIKFPAYWSCHQLMSNFLVFYFGTASVQETQHTTQGMHDCL